MADVYQLSDYGRAVNLGTWRAIGGCGLANNHACRFRLADDVLLGQIEDACPMSGRTLARFAVERLNIPSFAERYNTGESL